MKKAMLSQPMAGKTNEEIVATREKAISVLKEKGYEIVNTLFTDEWYSKEKMAERGVVQIPLCVTQLIFAKDGKMQEAVELNMRRLLRMDWKFCMRSK